MSMMCKCTASTGNNHVLNPEVDRKRFVSARSSTLRMKSRKQKYLSGWRVGVIFCCATVGAVLLINIVVTICASVTAGVTSGIGTLQHGDCSLTKEMSLWLYFAINVLSTMLLGASNYCMQFLSSPTREGVDTAHANGR